jgi:hypothetical protein
MTPINTIGTPQPSPFWLRCLPLSVFQVYLTITVLAFFIGPYPWPIENPVEVVAFLVIVQVAFLLGYLSSARRQPAVRHTQIEVEKMIQVVIFIGTLWAIPAFMIKTVTVRDTYGGPIGVIIAGLTKPGEIYNHHQTIVALRQSGGLGLLSSGLMTVTDFLLSPFVSIAMPLGVVMWHRLTSVQKAGVVFITGVQVASWIGIGTNKGLFDIAILLPWLYIAQQVRLGRRPGAILKKVAVVAGILGTVVLGYFFIGGMERHSDRGTDIAQLIDVSEGYQAAFNILPESVAYGILRLSGYVTQGYYALSLALPLDFEPCWGLGNSYWLASWTRALTGGVSILEQSYPGRLQAFDLDLLTRWHSFYVWFASDVSFYGVPVIVFLVGRALSSAWIDAIWGSDVYSVGFLHLLIIMVIYFPGNNQVLGFAPSGIPFIVFAFLRMLPKASRIHT